MREPQRRESRWRVVEGPAGLQDLNEGYIAPTATRGSIWLTPTTILPERYARLNLRIDF